MGTVGKGIGNLSSNLADSKDVLQKFLQLAPTKIDVITRTAVNGSWFNFYVCGAGGYVVLPGTTANSSGGTNVPVNGFNSGEAGC